MNCEIDNLHLDSHWKASLAENEIVIAPANADSELRILVNELNSLVNIGKGFSSVMDDDCFFGNVNQSESRWFALLFDRTNGCSVFVENPHGGVFHWEEDGLHCPTGDGFRVICI